jgi:gas vesicle protein
MKSGKLVLGVLAGLAAGATLGILFAPARGKSTRKKISRKAHQYADDIRDKSNEFTDSMSQKYQAVKDGGERIVEKWNDMVKESDTELK